MYAAPALRAVAAARAMGKAEAALTRGDLGAAEAAAQAAVARDPGAARPWLAWTRALAAAGRPTEAAAACRRAAAARPRNPVAPVLLPQLLRESGRADESEAALGGAHDAETRAGVWQTLEAAWSALPPPRRDEVAVGSDDYGAVRGFFSARGTYRWTWKRSFLRLLPTRPAPAYEVTLVMGSPEPSPLSAPVVTVRAKGAPAVRFTLARASAPFTLRARPAPGAPVIVEITSPTWTRLGENADEGVAVERMTVAPARE